MDDLRKRWGLKPLINVSGTNTVLGASKVHPEVRAVADEMMRHSVDIHDLQAKASEVIARATGAEAGCVVACVAAGISQAVAGCMTGSDLGRIEQLPDTAGMADEVVVQHGQMVHYGGLVDQNIRLAGATPVLAGASTRVMPYQLAARISDRTAAALYVQSHHSVQVGQIPFGVFAQLCHEHEVPVIVDLANEHDLTGFLEQGADITLHSAHKILHAPTAGIVAGRKDLVRATYLQTFGLGRGMKVGKEGIAGAIAALELWMRTDHAARRTDLRRILTYWQGELAPEPGVAAAIVADEQGNPIDRLRVAVDPVGANISAAELAGALARGDPPILCRDHEVEHGFFFLDPGHLLDGEAQIVAEALRAELTAAKRRARWTPPRASFVGGNFANMDKFLDWPNRSA